MSNIANQPFVVAYRHVQNDTVKSATFPGFFTSSTDEATEKEMQDKQEEQNETKEVSDEITPFHQQSIMCDAEDMAVPDASELEFCTMFPTFVANNLKQDFAAAKKWVASMINPAKAEPVHDS